MLTAILPLMLLLHPGHGHSEDPEWDCDDPQLQQEMNYCAAQEFRTADDALNAQWSVTSDAMKRRDAEWEAEFDERPGYFATLLDAQRAWIAYRDSHCRNEAYLFRGGSIEPLIDASCKTGLTKVRTEQLRELAKSY